nr:hypothetical protein [Tanacetum cinerariifolium]
MAIDKKTNQSNPSTLENPPMPPISSFPTGGSSSQQHMHQPMSPISSYPTVDESAEEHNIDEEALREILEEEARDEKEQEEKIRQKQADNELFMLEFEDDFDLRLTPVLRPSSSTRVETSPSTQNPVRIIPGPTGIVQAAKLLKQKDILLGLDRDVMSTQEYMKKVVEDVGEDEDFESGSWVSVTDYVNANGGTMSGCSGDIKNFLNNGKLDQVKEQQQLLLDEHALRETLKEQARAEKEWEKRIKQEQAHDELFRTPVKILHKVLRKLTTNVVTGVVFVRRTPVKILHKVLRKLTTNVVTGVVFVRRYLLSVMYLGPHETFQCQPMDYYENSCYDFFGFDKSQPSQSVIDHLKLQQKINDLMIELRGTFQAWLQQRKDQVVNVDSYSPKPLQCQKIPIYYDDDDDEESSTPLRDTIISELPPCIVITPVLSTKVPKDSLIIGDEHLDTIPGKESDEFIKSSVENLVSNPSESEDLSNIRRECDVLVCDNFTTFSNSLFDTVNFSSSDDESFFDEDVPKEIYSNPLFDEEIISIQIDPHHFSAESDLIESLVNQDSLIISSSKIDSILDEFAGELILLKSIPPGINEADSVIESFSPFPILIEDSDPFIEEIDLFLTYDGSIPPGIDSDYSDSKGDNIFLERLLYADPSPLPDILDSLNIPACCDDDDNYDSAITPVLSSEETDNSLSMRDEHLDTIPATESDKLIKSSVEDLVPIQSESDGIPDTMCDVHLVNNSTPLKAKDHFEIVINSNDDISSSDDDSIYK